LVTRLRPGQSATVLQLPATAARREAEPAAIRRNEIAGEPA